MRRCFDFGEIGGLWGIDHIVFSWFLCKGETCSKAATIQSFGPRADKEVTSQILQYNKSLGI